MQFGVDLFPGREVKIPLELCEVLVEHFRDGCLGLPGLFFVEAFEQRLGQ